MGCRSCGTAHLSALRSAAEAPQCWRVEKSNKLETGVERKHFALYEQPVPLQKPYPLPPTHLTLCCPGSCHEINAIFITGIFERLPAQLVSWQQHRTVIVACFIWSVNFWGGFRAKNTDYDPQSQQCPGVNRSVCKLIRHLLGIFPRWGCVKIWPCCGAVSNEGGSSVKCVWIGRISSTHWSDLMAHEGPRHARRSAVNEDLRASGSTQNKTQQTQHEIVSHQSGSLTAPGERGGLQPPLLSASALRLETWTVRARSAPAKASGRIYGRRRENPEQGALLITHTFLPAKQARWQ